MDPHELTTTTLLLIIDPLTNCNKNCVSLCGNSIVLRIYIMACQAVLAKILKSFLLRGPKRYFL